MGGFILRNCDLADFDTLKTRAADIKIEGDKIVRIAPNIKNAAGETVIDCNHKLVMPAFVDAHTHMMQSFLKGPMDDYDITHWLVRMFMIEGMMTEDDVYHAVLLGCMQSLRFGTTTINEMCGYEFIDAAISAMRDAGIRATVGVSATDIAENDKTPVMSIDDCLKEADDVYTRFNGLDGGMIRTSVAPPGLPACSGDLMKALKGYANEKGIVFHAHLAEGKKETRDVVERTGFGGEGEALYRYGVLDENTLLAHSIWLEDYELDLIKESGANPVHCPNTNMKISDGIPKIHQMLERGINVCMGCDGEASSSTRDMIREARAGSYLQKAVTLDPTAMGAGTAYKMMTVNGARALGYKDLGEIKEGGRADLIVVDTSKDISLTNREYRLGNLLYAGTGHAVDMVFSNGSLVVSGGENIRIPEDKVIEKCEELLSRLNKKIEEI